ncbi:MAG: 2-oxoglutarate dehydrogenase complex dihydrolipoyllysine-residue succinyltransferase [Anaerolineae bacterium]|nr:2-oxoglutarate dehydrogenase complex dihydrolipoyllysine-residue succinyltransferase [Anaerolineae bacterium]
MTTEIVVPELGESVVEATVGEWHVQVGDTVKIGDIVVDLETDKVDVEVGATATGVITQILHPSGSDVKIGDALAIIDANGAVPASHPTEQPVTTATPARDSDSHETIPAPEKESATPVARRMAEAEGVNLKQIAGSGAGGRVTKHDVAAQIEPKGKPELPPVKSTPSLPQPFVPPLQPAILPTAEAGSREERVRMSRRRRTIAARLVEAQHTAAMLTTFNEIDMSAVMDMRKRRQEEFVNRHGVKLGFTSFFVKATIGALKAFPRLNAEIQGDDMVLKQYYDIGIAVGAEEGLVVPVIRNADRKSFAAIEMEVRDFSAKTRDGSLSLEDLRGGTFTITNGGVFGSMLSTPILNPPQVGILGLHNIQERPVVRNGEIVIRSMMYVALSYDHRIVDGREAVQFLVKVKQLMEDPEALLLEG